MPSVRGFLNKINPWHEDRKCGLLSRQLSCSVGGPAGDGVQRCRRRRRSSFFQPQPLTVFFFVFFAFPCLSFAELAPPPPPITTTTAVTLLVLYALVYLLPFYASKTTRPAPDFSRDAPSVIRARIRSVSLSCVICCLSTYVVLVHYAHGTPAAALHMMGLWPVAFFDSLRALFLTAALFAGPLFSYLVVDRGVYEWLKLQPLNELWNEWTTWRNIIAVCSAYHLPPLKS